MKFRCTVCGFVYDEEKENKAWENLPEGWTCPICGVGKELFEAETPRGNVATAETPRADGPRDSKPRFGRTAADVIAETLRNFGVKSVFGMVGHSNLGMADAFRKLAEHGDASFVSVRHEGAAAFAASAYGKLTGMPAACLTIAGPGATNLLTGLADAALDRAPVVALTGQTPTRELGRGAFQELDLTLALSVATRSRQTVAEASDFAGLAARACRSAILTQSVSHIVLPDDVQNVPVAENAAAGTPEDCVFSGVSGRASEDALNAAASMLSRAKRPFVVMGEGCRLAIPEAVAFAEALNAATATTYRAKGFVPDAFPLACGVVGRSGTPVAAKMMAEADCIVGLGVGFSNHSEIAKGKPTLQFDRDPAALGRLRGVDCGIVGDLAETLPLMTERLRGRAAGENPRERIAALRREWRAEKQRRAEKGGVGKIAPAAVCAALSECVPANAVVSADVGNVAYALGRYFEAREQRFLLSFYLGSIGVGLPAAIGAWRAVRDHPELGARPVVAVVGDGGLGQYLAEWTTVVRCGMDIKCVVFNNSELAKISLEQRNAHVSVWETRLLNPNFAEFAKLCGSAGVRIDDPAKLATEMRRAFEIPGPALIEVLTDPDGA